MKQTSRKNRISAPRGWSRKRLDATSLCRKPKKPSLKSSPSYMDLGRILGNLENAAHSVVVGSKLDIGSVTIQSQKMVEMNAPERRNLWLSARVLWSSNMLKRMGFVWRHM